VDFVPPKRKRGAIINVTSLIDVLFLLLIFFMVTSTFKNQPAITLVLPRSATAEDVVVTPTVVYLTTDGRLFLNDQPVAESALGQRLRTIHEAGGVDRVILRADEGASHGAVVNLIDLVKQAGFDRVSLSTRPAADR
jgi:biopolymer transport protein ExbD